MSEPLGKWLTVVERPSSSGKTSLFALYPVDPGASGAIGLIGWYGPWRKYSLQPEPGTVFEADCLRAIADFCETKTREHRAAARARA